MCIDQSQKVPLGFNQTNQKRITKAFCRHSKWGIWNSKFDLEVFSSEKWELRKDLTDIHFTTSTAKEPPYTTYFNVDPNSLPRGYKVPHSLF